MVQQTLDQQAYVEDCLRQVKDGHRSAFDPLVRMYKGKAMGLAYRLLGSVEDAKDVTQEAFVKAYSQIESFRGESSFQTWFYRILVNLARDCIRRRMRTRKIFWTQDTGGDSDAPSILDSVSDPRASATGPVLAKELGQVMARHIQALPQQQREAFVMRYVEHMSVSDIAHVLECRPSTVKVHVFRAVGTLRNKLSPYMKRG